MRKIISALLIAVLCSTLMTGCEQEEVAPQYELDDPELTVESGGEGSGDRPPSKNK